MSNQLRISTGVVLLLLFTSTLRACPSCRESLAAPASDSVAATQSPSDLPTGFNRSIYLILGGFVAVAGSASMFIAREIRQNAN